MKKITYLFLILSFISCTSVKNYNYFNYYPKVYEADSLMLFAKNNNQAFKKYKQIFKTYPPKNTELYDEYENYIKLGYKLNKNFGGRKSVENLIKINAGWWKYKKDDSILNKIYKKYSFVENQINSVISTWNSSLNHNLIDSISIIKKRDQLYRGKKEQEKQDKINENSLITIFETFGYPNYSKIGAISSEGKSLNIISVINHMSASTNYNYFEKKLLDFVKTGECEPNIYAMLVDRKNSLTNSETKYGVWAKKITDTVLVNKNRKSIGLPSLQYHVKMMKLRNY